MGIFSSKHSNSRRFGARDSESELNARVNSIRQRSGSVEDAISSYKRGHATKEDLRRELARHDSYFDFVDSED